jgi:hypothetical protein
MTGMTAALENSLPWYFGVVAFVVWSASIVGIALIGRRIIQLRSERRAAVRARSGAKRTAPDDNRSIGPGTDVEVW